MNATQIEFRATGSGASQCDRIGARLMASPGQWVAMTELWQVSGAFAVHSRVSDLRRSGMVIEQKNEHRADGTIHSFYRVMV